MQDALQSLGISVIAPEATGTDDETTADTSASPDSDQQTRSSPSDPPD